MNYSIKNRRKQFVFAAITAFFFLFAAQQAVMAQQKLKPGDEIPIGGG